VFNVNGNFKPGQILLPRSIVSALPEITGDCVISYSKNSICFEYANVTIKSMLMDYKYPDFMAIVPKNETKISVNRLESLVAIKRVLDFSNKVSKIINLSGNMVISGEDKTYKQKASEKLKSEGGEININVNGSYLYESLSHLGSEIIEINYQSFDKPIVINEPGDSENFIMIMPMMLV